MYMGLCTEKASVGTFISAIYSTLVANQYKRIEIIHKSVVLSVKNWLVLHRILLARN